MFNLWTPNKILLLTRELIMLEKLEKELNLKQLQIRSLTITQALMTNVQDGLFNMYKSFLSWEMGIEKWCSSSWQMRAGFVPPILTMKTRRLMVLFRWLSATKVVHHQGGWPGTFAGFDIIIPVFHKDYPIAYSLIGGIGIRRPFNKIQFITTITNIIAVAIENKGSFFKKAAGGKIQNGLLLVQDVQSMLIRIRCWATTGMPFPRSTCPITTLVGIISIILNTMKIVLPFV